MALKKWVRGVLFGLGLITAGAVSYGTYYVSTKVSMDQISRILYSEKYEQLDIENKAKSSFQAAIDFYNEGNFDDALKQLEVVKINITNIQNEENKKQVNYLIEVLSDLISAQLKIQEKNYDKAREILKTITKKLKPVTNSEIRQVLSNAVKETSEEIKKQENQIKTNKIIAFFDEELRRTIYNINKNNLDNARKIIDNLYKKRTDELTEEDKIKYKNWTMALRGLVNVKLSIERYKILIGESKSNTSELENAKSILKDMDQIFNSCENLPQNISKTSIKQLRDTLTAELISLLEQQESDNPKGNL